MDIDYESEVKKIYPLALCSAGYNLYQIMSPATLASWITLHSLPSCSEADAWKNAYEIMIRKFIRELSM